LDICSERENKCAAYPERPVLSFFLFYLLSGARIRKKAPTERPRSTCMNRGILEASRNESEREADYLPSPILCFSNTIRHNTRTRQDVTSIALYSIIFLPPNPRLNWLTFRNLSHSLPSYHPHKSNLL
jgi:hypothetical protein